MLNPCRYLKVYGLIIRLLSQYGGSHIVIRKNLSIFSSNEWRDESGEWRDERQLEKYIVWKKIMLIRN